MKVSNLFKWFVTVSLTAIILVGCQTGVNSTNQFAPKETNLPTEVPEPTKEPTPEPTETSMPTDTLEAIESPKDDIYKVSFGNPSYKGDNQTDAIHYIAFSPDGGELAYTASGKINILNMKNLTIFSVLDGHSDQIKGLVWTPDGKDIISGSLDGSVILWETDTYAKLAVFQTGPVYSLDNSPDGTKFVIGQDSGNIQFWDIASKEKIASIVSLSESTVTSVSWSPDGSLVACGDDSGDLNIIDSSAYVISHTLSQDESTATSTNAIEWSPDGKFLASGHQNGQVFLWDTAQWELVRTIEFDGGWVGDVTWLPNSMALVISGESGMTSLWDGDSGEFITSFGSIGYSVFSSTWSSNGRLLVLATGSKDINDPHGVVWFYLRTD